MLAIILMEPQGGGSGMLSTIIMLGIIFGIAYLIIRLITKKINTPTGDTQMLVCSKCGHQNAGGKFCIKCGTDLSFSIPENVLEINKVGTAVRSDKLLFIAICFLFVGQVFWFIMNKTVENWFAGEPKYIQIVLNIIAAFAPLLVALAIKKRTIKIISIVLSLAYAFVSIYSSVEWLSI